MKILYTLAMLMSLGLAGTTFSQPPATSAEPAAGPPPRPPYGAPITLAQARQVAAAAVAEGKKHGLYLTVAVVEPSGALVYYERDEHATYAAEEMAILKAKGAARYGHGGDVWKAQLDAKDLSPLILPGPVFQYHGSEVIVVGGKIIGAVGTTGGFDSEVARAGAAALK